MAAPTAKRVGLENTAETLCPPAARPKISKAAPTPTVAPILLGRFQMVERTCTGSPKSLPLGLEAPSPAQERPSCGPPESAPLVLAGGRGKEAASSVQTTRPSAGRPRKVSQRSAEKTSKQSVWRPRKVGQRTTDPTPKNLTAQVQRGKRKGKTRDDEKAHGRHRREEWEGTDMGATLQNHDMESGVLLGGPPRRSESLQPERWEDG